MLSYTIDDSIDDPLVSTVEVTSEFPGEKRWLVFATPIQLATNGGWVKGTSCRVHLGERHVIVVSYITPEIIEGVLQGLLATRELESRTIPLHDGA